MPLRVWLLLIVSCPSLAFANTRVRAVYKNPIRFLSSEMKRMTFGLSEIQTSAIRNLTHGKINLGDVYYQEVPANEVHLLSRSSGFSSVLYPNVPPPTIVEPWSGDPELKGEWWIQDLQVPEAWKVATGNGVVIADCDAGYHHDETDLLDNMLMDHAFDLADTEGSDIVNDGPFAYHGTAVAAIMAGVKNDLGTNGIAYNSKIVPLQNYNYDSKDDIDKEEATAACILLAIQIPKVSVIVLENQTATGSSETFVGTRDAVRLAMLAGITVVGAGGNYSVELKEEKADDTGSIIVGALARTGDPAWFTNYGERLTVGAYGEMLHTLYGPDGKFGSFGGTSGATPQVAATVAMMKEVNPFLSPERARSILHETRIVTPQNARAGGKLNVPGAVRVAASDGADIMDWSKREAFRAQLISILQNR